MVSIYLNYKYVEEDCVLYTVIGLDEAKSVNDHICFNNTLALHCWRNSSTANQKQEQRLCYGISDTEVWMHQSNSQHKRERVGQWDTLLWPFSYFIDYYTDPLRTELCKMVLEKNPLEKTISNLETKKIFFSSVKNFYSWGMSRDNINLKSEYVNREE